MTKFTYRCCQCGGNTITKHVASGSEEEQEIPFFISSYCCKGKLAILCDINKIEWSPGQGVQEIHELVSR